LRRLDSVQHLFTPFAGRLRRAVAPGIEFIGLGNGLRRRLSAVEATTRCDLPLRG